MKKLIHTHCVGFSRLPTAIKTLRFRFCQKYLNRIFALSFLMLIILQLAPLPAFAASQSRTHGIAEYTITIHINSDGSAQVEERIVNRFTGQFNGVFLDVYRRGFGIITDYSILEYLPDTGEYVYFTPVRSARAGDSGVFASERDGPMQRFQVFQPSHDEYRTFVYRYSLTQAAAKFLDAGQFNRTLIGADWDVPIEAYEVIITFEEAPAPDGQGLLTSTVYIAGNALWTAGQGANDIHFHSYGNILPPGQSLRVSAVFPAEWLPDAPVTNRSIDARPFPWLWVVLAGIGAIIVTPIAVIATKARPHKVDFSERYYDKLPADNGPALMAYLVRDRQLKIKDIPATLLNMAKDGILTIDRDINEPDNYRFTRKQSPNVSQDSTRRLRPHEEFLIQWLFEGIGNGTSVGLAEIKLVGMNEDTALLFHEKFNDWAEIVKAEADSFHYYESYWRRTPHGELEYRQWRAFKRYLKDLTDIDQSYVGAHAFWDKYLPYALSLGGAKKLMKKMPHIPNPAGADAGISNWDSPNMLWFSIIGPQMLSACTGTFSTTYNHGLQYASSGDGSGSGYSVSSSIGGGGSSGGAF